MKSIQQTYFCGGKERNLATIHGRTNQNDKKSLQMLIHTDKLNIFSSVFRQSQKNHGLSTWKPDIYLLIPEIEHKNELSEMETGLEFLKDSFN